jgi:hypothetical protein
MLCCFHGKIIGNFTFACRRNECKLHERLKSFPTGKPAPYIHFQAWVFRFRLMPY